MSAVETAYQGDDLELRQMMEWSHSVYEMMQHPGWQPYQDFLYSEIAAIHRRLHDAKFTDISEYRMWAGKAQGIEQALTAFERMERVVQSQVEARGEAEPAEETD